MWLALYSFDSRQYISFHTLSSLRESKSSSGCHFTLAYKFWWIFFIFSFPAKMRKGPCSLRQHCRSTGRVGLPKRRHSNGPRTEYLGTRRMVALRFTRSTGKRIQKRSFVKVWTTFIFVFYFMRLLHTPHISPIQVITVVCVAYFLLSASRQGLV